jgi:hypothetical protein
MTSTTCVFFSGSFRGMMARSALAVVQWVSDVGVDAVSEIDGRGAGGELDHVALGGEHVDRVAQQLLLDLVQEVRGDRTVRLQLLQLVDEGRLLGLLRLLQRAALVQPVRGNPVFRGLVHGLGAELDLDDLAVEAHHRGWRLWYRLDLGMAM